jgi:L-histidine N-alpha-methyltransferase
MNGRLVNRVTVSNYLNDDFSTRIADDVRRGLSRKPKAIPSKYFYDSRGSRLFDQICALPEYYPTRTEIGILRDRARSIMSFFEKRPGLLVEIGSGSDVKIRQLFERIDPAWLRHIRYVPMDISADCVIDGARRLLADFQGLSVEGIIADFTCHLEQIPSGRKMIVFLGGTFGNFTPAEGNDLLMRLAATMGAEDRLLIGLDMVKDRPIIEAAYNDRAGVTAAFNLNILNHINQRLGANFDMNLFEHHAFFNPNEERIEMHLRARDTFSVQIAGLAMASFFRRNETIRTEISQKFSRQSAQARFRKAGLEAVAWHTDAQEWFSLVELAKKRFAHVGSAAHAAWSQKTSVYPDKREAPA